ncbi:MAG: alpha/beta fold hydrolase [Proteobacteria bacterium]|nr:alpha/beta fold hydrolase [Pseudomonadota bacterium]
MAFAPVNGLNICFEDAGEGPVLLLVMGISAQHIVWHPEFVQGYVDAGFRVIVYDHRDIGESSWLEGVPAPTPIECIGRRVARLSIPAPYTLSDMASDAMGLLDHLGIEKAHVMGISMGGMIAQHIAIEHPERVLSMTSIMSGPGSVRHMVGEPSAIRALLGPSPRTAEQAMDGNEHMFRTVGGELPIDIGWVRERARLGWERGYNPMGFTRHFAAITASGNRLERLATVRAPSTVVHGTADPLIPLRAGRATAHAVPDARLVEIEGMGHELSRAIWPRLLTEQLELAERA